MTPRTAKSIKDVVNFLRDNLRTPEGYGVLGYVDAEKLEVLLYELADNIKQDAIEP